MRGRTRRRADACREADGWGICFYFGLLGGIAGYLRGIFKDIAALANYAGKIAYYRDFFHYPSLSNHGEGYILNLK